MVLLKKIFAGLFGLLASLGKLVGIGKKGEFFVEMEPTPDHASPKQAVETVIEQKPKEKAAPAASKPQPVAVAAVAPSSAKPAEPAPKAEPPAATVPYAQFARRRPGANMAGFLSMAQQVRKPIF